MYIGPSFESYLQPNFVFRVNASLLSPSLHPPSPKMCLQNSPSPRETKSPGCIDLGRRQLFFEHVLHLVRWFVYYQPSKEGRRYDGSFQKLTPTQHRQVNRAARFLGTTYPNRVKYTKLPLNYQIPIKCTKWP
jgi:hypothetical protein